MVAAGALVFGALVSGVAMREGSAVPATSSQAQRMNRTADSGAASVHYPAAVEWPPLTIYVVSSEEQAVEVEARIAGMGGEDGSGHIYQVIVVNTPETLEMLAQMYSDIGLQGLGAANIVDLR
jgi:hypothetical protein